MRSLCLGLLVCAAGVPATEAFSSVLPLQLTRVDAVGVCGVKMMAGFGQPSTAKDSKAPTKITGIPKKTIANYGATVKAGATSYRVFARAPSEDRWYEVGQVASTPDSPDAACTLHKRLALEYAVDSYPALKPKAKMLELGYSASGEGDNDVVLVQKKLDAAITKDTHGFLPKSFGPKIGQGVANPAAGSSRGGLPKQDFEAIEHLQPVAKK